MSIQNNVKVPVVKFEYPDSETRHMKVRYVRVTEANEDYIKGYELDTSTGYYGSAGGKFKQYSRNRIASDGVALLEF